jgi:hypothetical protein
MNRDTLLELWNGTWDGDIWFTPWAKAIEGLTPGQAAAEPAPGRHSIWQNVNHVTFWREVTLAMVRNQPRPDKDELERRNFEKPTALSQQAWDAARRRLEESHRQIAAVIANPALPLDRAQHHLSHDAYHLGQVMLTRAILGLPPVV